MTFAFFCFSLPSFIRHSETFKQKVKSKKREDKGSASVASRSFVKNGLAFLIKKAVIYQLEKNRGAHLILS